MSRRTFIARANCRWWKGPLRLRWKFYDNGRAALIGFAPDGSPVLKFSVNVPEADLQPGEMLVKNYGENEGALETLVAAGVVRDTGRVVECGHATANVVEIIE